MVAKSKYDVELRLTGKDQASGALRSADSSMNKLGSTVKRVGAMLGAYFGTRALINFARSSMEAAQVQEDAENRLATALKDTNKYTRENLELLKEQASAMQRVSRYGDEQVMAAQQVLLGHEMDVEVMEKATRATLNLAAAKKMDLAAAAELVGRAFEGETSTLSRYGIIIEEGLEGTEKFDAVMEKIQSRFGTAAQADINSYAGRVEQLSNAWGDVKEKLGDTVTKSSEVNAAIVALTELFQGKLSLAGKDFEDTRAFIGEGINTLITGTGELIKLIPGFATAWHSTAAAAIKPIKFLIDLYNKLKGDAPYKESAQELAQTLAAWSEDHEQRAQGAFNTWNKVDEAKVNVLKRVFELSEEMKNAQDEGEKSTQAAKKGVEEVGEALDAIGPKIGLYGLDWKYTFECQEDLARRTAQNMERGFSDFFFTVMKGEFDSLEQVAQSFYNSMLRMLADLAARYVMYQVSPAMFGTAPGAGGGVAGSTASAYAPTQPMAAVASARPVDIHVSIDPQMFGSSMSPEQVTAIVASDIQRDGRVRKTIRRYI